MHAHVFVYSRECSIWVFVHTVGPLGPSVGGLSHTTGPGATGCDISTVWVPVCSQQPLDLSHLAVQIW